MTEHKSFSPQQEQGTNSGWPNRGGISQTVPVMNVLAVDPGIINYGWAVVDYNTAELVDYGVVNVRKAGDDDSTVEEIATLLKDVVARHKPFMFLIENQGQSMLLRGIELASIAVMKMLGVKTKVVHAITVKTHFQTRGLGCRGNKQNKLDAEALVLGLGYGNLASHVADCILMCIYMRECVDRHS